MFISRYSSHSNLQHSRLGQSCGRREHVAALSVARLALLMLVWLIPLASCSSSKNFGQYDQFCIVQSTETPKNEKWAHYLYTHFAKRCQLPELVTERPNDKSTSLLVKISYDQSLGSSYRIDFTGNELKLSAGSDDVMLWLVYQFISAVTESDARFDGTDLPPAAIEMDNAIADFPFEFRGIYSPSNADEDAQAIAASHHVDYHWALWGHNLWKILGDNPDTNVYATANGKLDKSQYCFSSEALYKAIANYIADQWGEGEEGAPARFTIMPMDNRVVCMCDHCKSLGNTETNATPAVTDMLRRLAKRFPHHLFFTSAYATTAKRPAQPLPANVGVLISAMDLPMVYDYKSAKEFADFDANIKAWQKLTPQVYIWDYSRNFDDYFTPYPCLSIMQQRVRYYASLGVKGVFINGSGEDYSSFDDLQTSALQALLVNPELDLSRYVRAYFHRFYPKTADLLADYYLALEQKTMESTVTLPYYGGIADAVNGYLNREAFTEFRLALDKASKSTKAEERARLNKLLTALSFTSLEIMRLNEPTLPLAKGEELLAILSGYEAFKDMVNSKEALGPVKTYIEQWNDDAQNAPANDLLRGKTIKTATPLGETPDAIARLTDGRLGFYTDYHAHWLVAPQQWTLTLPPINANTLKFSMLLAPAWRIWLPAEIKVMQGGNTIASWKGPEASADKTLTERHLIEISINNANHNQPLELQLVPASQQRATMGCDEIMAF